MDMSNEGSMDMSNDGSDMSNDGSGDEGTILVFLFFLIDLSCSYPSTNTLFKVSG